MYLDKSHMKFLKSIPENGSLSRMDILDSQLKIVEFLEDEKLINVKREVLNININPEMHTYKNTYGEIISISLSEYGKAYLEDIRTGKREKWIPIIISVLALLKSYDVPKKAIILCKKLLELLEKLQ